MNFRSADNSKSRFAAYVEGLVSVIGHTDRGERKSVEPMAAVTAPDRTAAQHQSLLHFVGQSPWSDEKVLAKVGEMVLPAIESQGPIEAWIIDDTGFPSTRSAWHASTAVSSVSGRTAKWRCRCHSPITTRACRWPGVSIYRKSGRPTLNIDARRASPMR